MFQFQSKNIVILLKSFVLGGAEKQALSLANYLQNKKNCNVYIYSYIKSSNTKLFYSECEKYNLKNLFVVKNPLSASGKFKYLKRRIKIALFGLQLRKHQPDIIIPYLNPPSIIASLCYKIAGAKTAFWHHRGADYYRNDAVERKAVEKTNLFIANSENGLKELKEKFTLPADKLFFLPNFSTIEKIKKSSNANLKKKLEGKVVIGMIAHFRKEKDQSLLLKTFSELSKKHDNIHLLLVGNVINNREEQHRFSELIIFIKNNSLEKNITILHNTNAEEVLPLLNIGVLVSEKEGMPNVIMEYMSYKLPIVTTNHSGCISLLGKEYSYLIGNSLKELTAKLAFLISNKEERVKIGRRNNERMVANFTIEKYVTSLNVILKE